MSAGSPSPRSKGFRHDSRRMLEISDVCNPGEKWLAESALAAGVLVATAYASSPRREVPCILFSV